MLLAGKHAVISGVGPGLGRSVALALAREGANVALGARSDGVLRSVAAEIEVLGRRALWRPTDVARAEGDLQSLRGALEVCFFGSLALTRGAAVAW